MCIHRRAACDSERNPRWILVEACELYGTEHPPTLQEGEEYPTVPCGEKHCLECSFKKHSPSRSSSISSLRSSVESKNVERVVNGQIKTIESGAEVAQKSAPREISRNRLPDVWQNLKTRAGAFASVEPITARSFSRDEEPLHTVKSRIHQLRKQIEEMEETREKVREEGFEVLEAFLDTVESRNLDKIHSCLLLVIDKIGEFESNWRNQIGYIDKRLKATEEVLEELITSDAAWDSAISGGKGYDAPMVGSLPIQIHPTLRMPNSKYSKYSTLPPASVYSGSDDGSSNYCTPPDVPVSEQRYIRPRSGWNFGSRERSGTQLARVGSRLDLVRGQY